MAYFNTELAYELYKKDLDSKKYLVKHGADVNKKDGDENTAYDIAKENQFFGC